MFFRQHSHVHKGVLDVLADDIFTRIMELNKKITDMLDEHKDILYFKALFGLWMILKETCDGEFI